MDLQLQNKRVLITGSTRGIGAGIAQAFEREGAQVVTTGIRSEASFAGDLTEPASVVELVKFVDAKWGALDVLVLNLGSGKSVPGMTADAEEWNRVLSLNLVSTMETLRSFIPLLKKGAAPSVVMIGSIAGLEDCGAPIAYAAAKAALTQAMKSSSRLLAVDGIRVNMVAPGNIHFAGGTWDLKQREDPERVAKLLEAEVPMKRFGTVDEVASVVMFLSSSQASFVTGSCVTVDGGQTRQI